jgi:hypothetical protein
MLIIGALFFKGTMVAFAADIPPTAEAETLTVDEVWLTGDTLHISVTDKNGLPAGQAGGDSQTLELNLSDYAKSGDEYVTVQATDNDGRTSNAIQFKNPYYTPPAESENSDGDGGDKATVTADNTEKQSQSAVSEGNPFTPDGTGSVVDNATDGDGKEFFTVETADGNVFYLIVDRQRNAENVYLLNAVNEDDLTSLAKPGDGKSGGTTDSAVTVTETTPTPEPQTTDEPTPVPAADKDSGNKGMLGILVVVLIVVGGIGYYFKIVRPKQNDYDYENEEDYAEPAESYPEPREEEADNYATSDDEAVVEESEVSDE